MTSGSKPPQSPGGTGAEMRSGARDAAPIAVGVAAYGLAFGLLAVQAGMSGLEVGVMGLTVFGGASQIVAVERLAAGAGAGAAIAAGLALNLRLFLISASNRDLLAGRPWWQMVLGAHFTVDENWALTKAKQMQGHAVGYWYFLGAAFCLATAWIVSGVAGAVFATAIPEPKAYGLDFAFAAAFIAIGRALWRGRQDLLPWVAAAAAVVLTAGTGLLDPTWGIVLGGLAGAAVAAAQAKFRPVVKQEIKPDG